MYLKRVLHFLPSVFCLNLFLAPLYRFVWWGDTRTMSIFPRFKNIERDVRQHPKQNYKPFIVQTLCTCDFEHCRHNQINLTPESVIQAITPLMKECCLIGGHSIIHYTEGFKNQNNLPKEPCQPTHFFVVCHQSISIKYQLFQQHVFLR